MRKRTALALATLAIVALVTVLGVSVASGGRKASTILIGISAAKTGGLAPYDLQSGQLFQMRIAQINKSGGVLGKQLKTKWIDTKSDKPTAATNAQELIWRRSGGHHRHLRLRLLVPGDQRCRPEEGARHRALRLVAEGGDAGHRLRSTAARWVSARTPKA